MTARTSDDAPVPGVVLRRQELDPLSGLEPGSVEYRREIDRLQGRQKELDVLQELARVATRSALERYEPISEEWKRTLTLGTLFDGDDRVFQLYVAKERPADAIVLASARVNRLSKSVTVEVTNLQLRHATPTA